MHRTGGINEGIPILSFCHSSVYSLATLFLSWHAIASLNFLVVRALVFYIWYSCKMQLLWVVLNCISGYFGGYDSVVTHDLDSIKMMVMFIIIVLAFSTTWLYLLFTSSFHALAPDFVNNLYYGISFKLNIINLQLSSKYKFFINRFVVESL